MTARVPLTGRVSVYGEGGLGFTSRRGFTTDGKVAVPDAVYASVLLGAGVEYRVNRAWDLTSGVTYVPGQSRNDQGHTLVTTGGFRYTMRQLPADRVEATRRSGFVFPVNLVQVEYSTGVGYGINRFVSRRVPIFWDGIVKVDRGVAVHYDRNVYHTKKVFALGFGASTSVWRSQGDRVKFFTLSAYPVLRFTLVRTKPADFYVCYSLAGPTYISRSIIDGLDTGRHFTFQDFIGMGVFAGKTPERQRWREDQPLLEWKYLHEQPRRDDPVDVRLRVHVLIASPKGRPTPTRTTRQRPLNKLTSA